MRRLQHMACDDNGWRVEGGQLRCGLPRGTEAAGRVGLWGRTGVRRVAGARPLAVGPAQLVCASSPEVSWRRQAVVLGGLVLGQRARGGAEIRARKCLRSQPLSASRPAPHLLLSPAGLVSVENWGSRVSLSPVAAVHKLPEVDDVMFHRQLVHS